jgi:hypothetical protein
MAGEWFYRHRWHDTFLEMKEHPVVKDEVWVSMDFNHVGEVGPSAIVTILSREDMEALHYSIGLYLDNQNKLEDNGG